MNGKQSLRWKTALLAPALLLLPLLTQAGTWGTMNFSSGKWGATPDVYTITSIEPGPGDDDLIVTFVLDGAGAAPETVATSFTVTCGSVMVTEAGSPITVTSLGGDEEYTCTVVATNSTGSSSPSVGQIGYPDGVVYGGLNIILIKAALDAIEGQ